MTKDRVPTTEAIYAEHRICGKPKYDGCYSHNGWREHCRADGMAWPCDVDTLRAAAQPAPPLDVERLADALDNLYEQRWGPTSLPPGSTTICGAYAEQIAAEYARLGSAPSTPEARDDT